MPSSPWVHANFLTRVGDALLLTQGQLGEKLGVSRRTVNRWVSRGFELAPFQARELAQLVHRVDAALAAEIAAAVGSNLEAMGVVAPAHAAQASDANRRRVDTVVCAAAEALDLSPRAVRPALLAAFRRARETGLTLGDVEAALTPVATAERAESER
ncbi:MAG TPA: helix-turn-helix transcriptional regulator [Polyangiaceae bacterium]|jgi:hypothetical protein